MPTKTFENRTFDARPDRIDLRDRMYQPKLVSLPPAWPHDQHIEQYLPDYARTLVLDQGAEGACTGFGLAAMINYLQWKNNGYRVDGLTPVSPRMLYHMAQLYDEWAGEDYVGSSCRGAMKGWHRHGVCTEAKWPYRNGQGEAEFIEPDPGWAGDAATRPLGAYYRIEKNSIGDMQSAIFEVGAIYCSADVHPGWFMGPAEALPVIKQAGEKSGGHAFALVGFNSDGFIIQNSWGPSWGYHGFAVVSYEEWIAGGTDAWVAVLGAPMRSASVPATFSTRPLQQSAARPADAGGRASAGRFRYRNGRVRPLSESEAYLHTLVLGNNGMPINRIVSRENAVRAVEHVALARPLEWFEGRPGEPPKLAIYVHGGLTSECASIERIRKMAPYFRENGIYPLFVSWKTGALESIGSLLEDSVRSIFRSAPSMPDEGVIDRIREALGEARDRSIEVACENLLVRPLWSEMKQNAGATVLEGGGTFWLARHLQTLRERFPNLEVHLAGHSAGAIVVGHLFDLFDGRLDATTLTLTAPACTLEFAVRCFGGAVSGGRLAPETVHVDILDDERERADTAGPYGKSVLYLISRALEFRHKTPLLGMEWAWPTTAAMPEDQWSRDANTRKALADWAKLAGNMTLHRHGKQREYVSTGAGHIRLSHNSFDNDIEVVSAMLKRMRGGPLLAEVENLAD